MCCQDAVASVRVCLLFTVGVTDYNSRIRTRRQTGRCLRAFTCCKLQPAINRHTPQVTAGMRRPLHNNPPSCPHTEHPRLLPSSAQTNSTDANRQLPMSADHRRNAAASCNAASSESRQLLAKQQRRQPGLGVQECTRGWFSPSWVVTLPAEVTTLTAAQLFSLSSLLWPQLLPLLMPRPQGPSST